MQIHSTHSPEAWYIRCCHESKFGTIFSVMDQAPRKCPHKQIRKATCTHMHATIMRFTYAVLYTR